MKKLQKLAALLLALMFIVSSCGNSQEKDPVSSPETKEESKDEKQDDKKEEKSEENGGSATLKIGVMFAPTDTLDPIYASSAGGMILVMSLYDSLSTISEKGATLRLAESITPNETFDEYKIVLRENAKFSDGTPVTGKDALDSLAYLVTSPLYQVMYGGVDFENSSAEGNTLTLKLKTPASDFLESCLSMFSPVGKEGKFEGIGAGGYFVESGDSQTGYKLKRNEHYYGGAPEIAEVTLLNIADSNSKAQALLTGEIDYAWGLDTAAIQTLKGNDEIELPESSFDSAAILDLTLNTRMAPFNDPELRRAAKLVIDREKLVKTILGDYGEVGNDMIGKGYADYPDDIEQTVMNKEEAKKIFEAKGVKSFTIVTSDVSGGLNNATKIMAQDFSDIGVEVKIEEMDPQSYYANFAELYKKEAFVSFWINRLSITNLKNQIIKDGPYNTSGYYSDITETNYKKALSVGAGKEQNEYIKAVQKDIHDNGGNIVWGYQKNISARRKGVECETTQTIPWLSGAKFHPEN